VADDSFAGTKLFVARNLEKKQLSLMAASSIREFFDGAPEI